MEISQLREKLRREKNRIGLVNAQLDLNEFDESKNYVSASISPLEAWKISISVKKGFQPIQNRRQRAYAKKKGIGDGLDTLLSSVTFHEFAHWELPFNSEYGCPYSPYWHDKILEAVKQALPEQKQGLASYVTNAFEDLIINPRVREFIGDSSGQVLFWDWEGIRLKEQGTQNYTKFYESFVKLNMHLFGNNVDKSLVKRHYSNSADINEAVKQVIQELSLPENIPDASVLFNKNSWQLMASRFTKALEKLLDDMPQERLSAFSPDNPQDSNGNSIEQKVSTKEGKEDIAFKRYENNEKPSANITSYEQLDLLYKRLARAIPVKVESITRTRDLEISPLTYRPFDEETDDPRRIKASRLILGEDDLRFAYPNEPLTVQYRQKSQRRSFPNFKMVVLDNSGSMKESPDGSNNIGKTSFIPWGDNSKYHYALLGLYGIENFLQLQGISQYIRHGMSLFSSSTRYQESGFADLPKLRRLALSPDFGNDTQIDAATLLNALNGSENFVLSISDGEIHNWNEAKNEFYKLAGNNHFAHIQIGSSTGFTSDLESQHIPVFYVSSGLDLSKLMINLACNTYRKYTRK